jgi:murein DD-endopeptidase MepM/ murein hydrolase activator NlpD
MSGFILPSWRITSPYGMRINPVTGSRKLHAGTDFGANSGTAIKAIAPGTVEAKGVNLDKRSGYGHWITIRQYDGTVGLYAHMVSASTLRVGSRVEHTTTVGNVGSTGASTGPHLHYEVRSKGVPVDPVAYAKARPVPAKPVAPPAKPGPQPVRHVIKSGDTLGSIAKKYGIKWQDLYSANRNVIGSNPNRIFAGQVLTIPGKAVASRPQPSKPVAPARKTVTEIAKEVIAGKWGVGQDRKRRLSAAGHDQLAVQREVNRLLKK